MPLHTEILRVMCTSPSSRAEVPGEQESKEERRMEKDFREIEEIEEKEEKERSLEELFADLDEILTRMNNREIPLEEAFALYEKGMKGIRLCNEKLDLVEKKMLMLTRQGEEEFS